MKSITTYQLFKFIQNVKHYEEGLIPKIKFFLHPRKKEYKFQIDEIIKHVYYELSYHNHHDEEGKHINHNTYCECYFNRKHRRIDELKKHKCIKLMKIIGLDYDPDTYEKKYICGYGFDYKYSCNKYEHEISKLSE